VKRWVFVTAEIAKERRGFVTAKGAVKRWVFVTAEIAKERGGFVTAKGAE
jgi:hypothetical protein